MTAVQELIADLIRSIGYVALRLMSLGRYRGGGPHDGVPEAAIGLAIVLIVLYLFYTFAPPPLS